MTTAIDTNIVSWLWSADPRSVAVAEELERRQSEGQLIMCGTVFAELMAYPGASAGFVTETCQRTRIHVDFEMGRDVWKLAGEVYVGYVERRRRSGGGSSKGLLSDYVIGAHATLRANRLLTLDRRRYAPGFPTLVLIDVPIPGTDRDPSSYFTA